MLNKKTQLQIKVYSRWVANKLKDVQTCHVEDITQDLANGVALIELAHILTGEDIPNKYTLKSRSKYSEIEKCDYAISMFAQNGVKLGLSESTISGSDINSKNVKQTLSLIWLLILNYSIDPAVREDKDFKFHNQNLNIDPKNIASRNSIQLLTWATNKTKRYLNTKDKFCPYDLHLCALLSIYFPKEINYGKINPNNHEENLNLANQIMKKHGIPIFIKPEDLKDTVNYEVDEGSIMTQLSALKETLDKIDPTRTSLVGRHHNTFSEHPKKDVIGEKYQNKSSRSQTLRNDNPNVKVDDNDIKIPDKKSQIKEKKIQISDSPKSDPRTKEIVKKQANPSDDYDQDQKIKDRGVDIQGQTSHSSPKHLKIRVKGKLDQAIVITVKRKSRKFINGNTDSPSDGRSSNRKSNSKLYSLSDEQCKIVPIYNKNGDNSASKGNDFNVKVKNNDYEIEEDFPDSVSGMHVLINQNQAKRKKGIYNNDDE